MTKMMRCFLYKFSNRHRGLQSKQTTKLKLLIKTSTHSSQYRKENSHDEQSNLFSELLFHFIFNFSQAKISNLDSEILKQKIETDEKYTIGVAEARELEKEKQHGTVEELKLRLQIHFSHLFLIFCNDPFLRIKDFLHLKYFTNCDCIIVHVH